MSKNINGLVLTIKRISVEPSTQNTSSILLTLEKNLSLLGAHFVHQTLVFIEYGAQALIYTYTHTQMYSKIHLILNKTMKIHETRLEYLLQHQ